MNKNFTFTELADTDSFDPLSISPHAPFPQSNEFRTWQQSLDREVRRFLIRFGGQKSQNGNEDGEILGFFQIIKYELPLGKSFAYIPYGPFIKEMCPEALPQLLLEFKNFLSGLYSGSNIVFVRLDFSLDKGAENEVEVAKIFARFFKKPSKSTFHAAYLQPRAEWYLDVTEPEDVLLKKMHEKTRYLVNLSARKGVRTEIIEKDFKKYFENFYSLLKETADRNNFSLHSKKYYENIFDEIDKSQSDAFVSIAKYENKILVMNLVVKYGNTAHFIFGGSSDEHRNMSPSHAAHWAAILHAKKIGAQNYNFGGISETADEKTAAGAKDHLASLTTFKKKFGGYAILHNYCYDLVIKQTWYSLYVLRKVLKEFF